MYLKRTLILCIHFYLYGFYAYLVYKLTINGFSYRSSLKTNTLNFPQLNTVSYYGLYNGIPLIYW